MRLYEVLVSDINDIFPFPTFSKAVSAILTPRSFLVYLIFLTKSTWLVLARMATSDGGDSDLPKEVCDIINCVAIYYEKDV